MLLFVVVLVVPVVLIYYSYYLDFLVEGIIVVEIKKGDYFAHRNIQQVSS